MQETQSLQDFKDCFAPSIFFSTQPSSCSINPPPRQPSPRQTLPEVEPRSYLRQLKLRKKQANGALLSALCESVRARSNLDRAEHQASICRQQFLKLYHNKKFKLMKNNIIEQGKQDNDYIFRQTVNRIRQQKMNEKEAISDRREIQLRNVENLQQINKLDQKIFRQTLRRSDDKLKLNIFSNYSKVKKERADFSIRKKNLNDLNTTRSKFNYLSKINNQMQVIKGYQQELERMSNSIYQQQYEESMFAGSLSARYS